MAKRDEMTRKLRSLLPEDAVCEDEAYRAGVVLAAQVPAEKLREVLNGCRETGYYLESLTALDFTDTAELVYHMNCYEAKSRLAVRVLCTFEQPVPTVSDIYAAASWLEREVHEFYGIVFAENQDLRMLLLPEDADFYPLQKTFGKVHAYHKRDEIYG